MPKPIKITGDTSDLSKSILDVVRDIDKLSGKKSVSIFDARERAFIKTELSKALEDMNQKFTTNKALLADITVEHEKLHKGTSREIESRKKIVDLYKRQADLAKNISTAKAGLGGQSGMLGAGKFLKGGVLAAGAAIGSAAVGLSVRANTQARAGFDDRIRAQGLGIQEKNIISGSPRSMARVGLSEDEMVSRRVQTTANVGLKGGSFESILQQSEFERSKGLQKGQMSDIMQTLRPSIGGDGANDAQLKLQAAINAAGIKEAVGPQLDVLAALLADINKNGLAGTDEMIRLFAGISSEKVRTPEQVATVIQSVNDALKNSSGEANAFFQVAYANAGIGGGTIGATQLAIEEGLFSPTREQLQKRGYSKELLDDMEKNDRFSTAAQKSDAQLAQLKQMGGVSEGIDLGDISSAQQVGVSRMANSVFGTKGAEGFDIALALEQRKAGTLSQKDLESKVKDIQSGTDPSVEALNTINTSLSGNAALLTTVNSTLSTRLGLSLTPNTDTLVKIQGKALESLDVIAAYAAQELSSPLADVSDYLLGGIGSNLYDNLNKDSDTEKLPNLMDHKRLSGLSDALGFLKNITPKKIAAFLLPDSSKGTERGSQAFKMMQGDFFNSTGLAKPDGSQKEGASGSTALDKNSDELKKLTQVLQSQKAKKDAAKTSVQIQNILPDGAVSNSTLDR